MKKFVILSLSLLGAASMAHGQDLLFSDDFSTSSEGNPVNTLWKAPQNWSGTTPGGAEVTTENSVLYFGEADNGYLRLWRGDIGISGAVFVESQPLDESIAPSVITLALDFYRPEITSWASPNNKNPFPTIVVGREDAFAGGGNRVPYRLEFAGQNGGISGAAGLFQDDTLHSMVFVYNNSSETITYSDGSGLTLGSSRYDLWIDGERVRAGIGGTPHSNPSSIQEGDPLTTIGFGSFSREGEILIDNVALYSGAVGPSFIEAPVSEGYAGWMEEYFPGISDPAVIGPEADPDGDGIPNLLEYALGTDPAEASRASLPILGVETFEVDGEESEYLTLTAVLADELSGVDFAVEMASVPGNWIAGNAVSVNSVPNGDGTTSHTFRDSEPVDSNARRFMRLQVNLVSD